MSILKKIIHRELISVLLEQKKVWSDEEIRKEASKYDRMADFNKLSRSASSAARRKGKDYFDDVTSHMDKSYYKFWSDEDLRREALKYSKNSDFQKNAGSAYNQALSRGKDFLDDITSHMTKKRGKWTDDELKQEALKYDHPSEFQKNSTAYSVALRRGKEFYDDITSHMTRKLTDYSDDELRNIAKEFKTKPEFMKGSPKAYGVAMRRGQEFWDDITSHMPNLHKSWTDETLKKEALKYNTPTEFYNANPSAYKLSLNRGDEFFQEVTSHMTRLKTWDEDSIKQEALKYKSKPEFRKNSATAYQAADRLGIMDEVTSHMIPVGSRYKRLIYAYEFPDNSVYIGLTYNLDKRDYSHMNRDTSAVFRHIQDTGLKPIKKTLTKFLNKDEASKMEGKLENQYRVQGWNILNRTKTGALGGDVLRWKPEVIRVLFLQYNDLTKLYEEQPSAIAAAKREGMDFYQDVTSHIPRKITKWTDEMLRDEASKYKTRQQFRDANPKAYNTAKRKGDDFYNDITSHMVYQRKQWTDDLLRQEALKYKTKNEFAKSDPTAYKLSKDRGQVFFDEITSHMPKLRTNWDIDKLKNEIKKYDNMIDFKNNSPKAYGNLKYKKLLQMAKDYYNSKSIK